MYADPLSVTVNAVAKTLPRIFSEQGQPSTFKTSDDSFKLEVSHSTVGGRRERHLIRLTQTLIAPDALNAALNVENKSNCYIVLDNPKLGFTDAQLGYIVKALTDFVSDSGNLVKFVGGEA